MDLIALAVPFFLLAIIIDLIYIGLPLTWFVALKVTNKQSVNDLT